MKKHFEDVVLSPEQIAEIERCFSDSEPYAEEAEVREVFARLTKSRAETSTSRPRQTR
jgi:hypothetical protein